MLYKMKEDIETFSPTPDSIPQMEAYLEGEMEKYEIPMKKMSRMNVAIDEIYSNIVNYSHATWVQGSLTVEEKNDEKMLVVKFLDNGIPYNPLEKADPDVDACADDREIGGLGVFLAKKLMNEIIYRYESDNNINILKLKL